MDLQRERNEDFGVGNIPPLSLFSRGSNQESSDIWAAARSGNLPAREARNHRMLQLQPPPPPPPPRCFCCCCLLLLRSDVPAAAPREIKNHETKAEPAEVSICQIVPKSGWKITHRPSRVCAHLGVLSPGARRITTTAGGVVPTVLSSTAERRDATYPPLVDPPLIMPSSLPARPAAELQARGGTLTLRTNSCW
jgi:hypothetical protein